MAEHAVHERLEDGHQEHGNRLYFLTWFWLLLLTVTALGVELYGGGLPRALAVAVFLTVMLLKASLIVANFMHMRFEHVQLVVATFLPLVLLLIMFVGMVGDFGQVLAR